MKLLTVSRPPAAKWPPYSGRAPLTWRPKRSPPPARPAGRPPTSLSSTRPKRYPRTTRRKANTSRRPPHSVILSARRRKRTMTTTIPHALITDHAAVTEQIDALDAEVKALLEKGQAADGKPFVLAFAEALDQSKRLYQAKLDAQAR